MSNDPNYLLILEKLSDLKADIKIVNSEISNLKEAQDSAKMELEKVKEQDEVQNKLLAEHILGVKTNAERLSEEIAFRKEEKKVLEAQLQVFEARLQKAEFIPNFISNAKTILLWVSGVAGALTVIGKFLNLF